MEKSDRNFLILIGLAWLVFIMLHDNILYTNSYTNKGKKIIPINTDPVKQIHDTTELDMYKYTSGATGSLRFDWMTGEKGKLINNDKESI